MIGVATKLDSNFNKLISYEEFTRIVDDDEALACLIEVGVNPVGIAGMAELFFIDTSGELIELTFERFMEMVLDLREENEAKVKNMKWLWMKMKMNINDVIAEMRTQLKAMEKEIERRTTKLEE